MGLSVATLALAKKYTDEQIDNVSSSIPPDWNQNDETAPDYIKNRPFYSTGEYERTEVMKATQFHLMFDTEERKQYMVGGGLTLIEGVEYLVVIGDQEYICKAQPVSSAGYLVLGNAQHINDKEFGWPDEAEPFVIFGYDYPTLMYTKPDLQLTSVTVYKIFENIYYLDKKYVSNFLAGEKIANTEVLYDGKTYICGEGAEIFNSNTNRAIGVNSHAEGERSIALGSTSHAEGNGSKALESCAHAEGGRTIASGNCAHAEGSGTIASGHESHAEGYDTQATNMGTHAEGRKTIANTAYLHVQGRYNIAEDVPKYSRAWMIGASYPEYDGDKIVYIFNDEPTFNANDGNFSVVSDPYQASIKELKKGDYFVFTYPESDIIETYYYASKLSSSRTDEATGKTFYTWEYSSASFIENTDEGTYLHIVGNGDYVYDEDLKTHVEKRSNAHTLDWDGNGWYAGDVYVGSTSGTNRDEGSKKLATEDKIVGVKTEGTKVTFEDKEYTCAAGAEVFNNLETNLAIGANSHAEGNNAVAIGLCSHAEGGNTVAKGNFSHAEGGMTRAESYGHAEGYSTSAIGMYSHSEGKDTEASADGSHVEGQGTVSSTRFAHTQGIYNIKDDHVGKPVYATLANSTPMSKTFTADETVSIYEKIELNILTGELTGETKEIQAKDLQLGDQIKGAAANEVLFVFEVEHNENEIICSYLKSVSTPIYTLGKYAHIVGNGGSNDARSNAHTLDWDGNAWFAGDVYVGSTSGINRDEGSKKLVTEFDLNNRVTPTALMLADINTGIQYKIQVVDGKLTMTEATV